MHGIFKEKVAAYCRVSTDKDDQLTSLEAQKDFFEEYVRINNYDLVKLYSDEGISGTKLKNRRAFNQMMEDAKDKKFTQVFVKDISRFSRNALDFLSSIRALKAMGIKCDFVNANLSTEDGEFTLGILALVAQEESANLSKRVKFGKIKNAQNGRVPNFVYGYDKINGDLFNLKINPSETLVVKRIFEMYNENGYGTNKIAEILANEGIKTKRGCLFSQNAVSRILKNPIYIGKVVNCKETINDFLTGARVKTDESSWITIEKPELSIISEDQFYKAQKIIGERQSAFRPKTSYIHRKYPFSTLIKCGCCGYSFKRISRSFISKDYIKWTCSGKNLKGLEFCNNQGLVDEQDLLTKIRLYIIDLIDNPDKFLKSIINNLKKEFYKNEFLVDKKALQDEIQRLEKMKNKQIQMYETDVISINELMIRTKKINNSIQRNTLQLKSFSEDDFFCNRLDTIINTYCKDIDSIFNNKTMNSFFMQSIVSKILVAQDGNIEVCLASLNAS